MSSLVEVPDDLVGRDMDLGTVTPTEETIRRYLAAVGDGTHPAQLIGAPPLGLALALRGGPTPSVAGAAGTLSVHGGHTITMHRPFMAGDTYRVRSRIVEIFEKNGRSGRLAVIRRQATLDGMDGRLVVTIDEHEIVRSSRPLPVETHSASAHDPFVRTDAVTTRANLDALAIGDLIAEPWRAPPETQVAAYSTFIGAPNEPLFTDAQFVRALGYRGVIVPGPMQSAAMEAVLRRRIANSTLVQLSLSFRMSIAPGDLLTMSAVVVEQRPCERGTAVACDLAIEHGSDRTAIGMAVFHPA